MSAAVREGLFRVASGGPAQPRQRSDRSQAQTTAAERGNCRRSTTDGTSRAEWYAAYGTLPKRAAGMPTASNDTWSLARFVHPLVATGAGEADAALRTERASAGVPRPPEQTGTAAARAPTRSSASMPRTA